MKKRFIAVLLSLVVLVCLCSCFGTYSNFADVSSLPVASQIPTITPDNSPLPASPTPIASAEPSDPYADLWIDETESAIPSPSPTVPPVSEENDIMVWISGKGKKYHSNPNCSNMKNPSQVTISEAESRGRGPCKKCY